MAVPTEAPKRDALKRAFDVAASAVLLLLLAPGFAFIGLIIKLDSRGPVFFRQTRVGRGGGSFSMLKFRKMPVDLPKQGPMLTRRSDPRLTRVGRWLERTKFDELPQLVNVLIGDMSMIGPRPEVPRFVDVNDPLWRVVLSVRPGLFGLSQNSGRNESSLYPEDCEDLEGFYREHVLPSKLRTDSAYVRRRGVLYDIGLLVHGIMVSARSTQGLGVPAAASHPRRLSDGESRLMRAIILAGGKGTRLHPYSLLLPKPLMPIVDFPVLEIGLRQLRHYGFTDVTITVGHLANLIMAFFGDGSKLGLRIRYAIEDVPLGTIGPLSTIPGLREENRPFLLMNGDTLTDMNFAEFAKAHSDNGTLVSVATYTKCLPIDLGVMELDGNGQLTAFKEKPVIPFDVSMGIYAMSPPVLDHIPSNRPFGFDDLMHHCLQENLEVHGHRHQGIWLDIGRPDDYRAAIETFENNRPSFCPWERNGK